MCRASLNIRVVLPLLMLFIPAADDVFGQLFPNPPTILSQTYNSAVNWVDIDSDGDLDLAVSGDKLSGTTGQGMLYLNNSGVLTYLKDITPMEDGDQAWSDFNNDGIPDLLYAGEAVGVSAGIDTFDVSLDYHNKFSGFTKVSNASVDWGDYDNDGDFDVLITGKDASNNVMASLYRNDTATFTDVNAGLPGVADGKIGFIDYDLDQDLDIFISGQDINGNKYTRLWKNTEGTYTVTSDLFFNLRHSQFDWGDINGDGYPDLILGGYDETSGTGYIYINNSGNNFSLSGLKVPKSQRGTSCFGDADNDGNLDVYISGIKPQPTIKNNFIFYNNATDSLIPDSFVSDLVYYSYTQFGDYDKDNDLDFVFNGLKEDGNGLTLVVNNSCTTPNTKPSAPVNLSSEVRATTITLRWDNSTDNNTPQESITYNIYLGITGNKGKIVAPNADITTGFRRISKPGYIRDCVWTIKDLPVGTYVWGVQAIDNSFGASVFSAEATFEIKERFTKVSSAESPSVTSPALYFDCDHDKDLDLLLNYSDAFLVAENTLASFSQANYRTLQANGYNPITTLTPNDFDNDNLIDFSISGNYTINGPLDSTIALYQYNSPFSYSVINGSLDKNLNYEFVLWADFNNDGKQDFITSGKTTNLGTENKPETHLFCNQGNGIFEKISHEIQGFEKCGGVTGDFDNDLDIDIIIYGKDSIGLPNTYLYRNEGNFVFTEELIPNNELFRQNLPYGIQTGDFDLDGLLDIYLAGITLANDKYARVLLNKYFDFEDANLQIRSSSLMSNFWSDYDYDGDIDIFSASVYTSPDKVRLYLNDNGSLQDEVIIDLGAKHKLDLPFQAVNLDNQYGLDFLMKIEAGNYIQHYDNWGSVNRLNSAPANTSYVQDKLDIILEWNKLPGCYGCTYNIRVGTTPGGSDIMSPMSDLVTGYRYVVQPGNTYLNNGWKLCDLPAGDYYWSVQAVDPSNTGGPWSAEQTFTVSLINADFSSSTECNGDSTVFNDLSVSTSNINKWKWTFGDGTTSTLRNPKHLYENAGTYTAGLWAYSEAGDSSYRSYPVTVKPVPVAGFTTDIACQGTATSFTNTTNVNGLTISSWQWNFGDGQSSSVQDPLTHGYLNPAEYVADLLVIADNGCSDFITRTVTVAEKPVAAVTADAPLVFCEGDSVTLSVPYNNKYSYLWMSGGIGITGEDSSKFVARSSGNYSVEIVNSVGNCKSTSAEMAITSNDIPVPPLITASGLTEFCQGDSVVLNVINTTGYTYQWKLNGGAIGTNSNQYTAKSSGTYSITVTNSSGCSVDATNTATVTVNPKPELPTVSIGGPVAFCQGGSVELSVTNNTAYAYQWENNGSAITNATTSAYTAQSSGVFSLKITNSDGCYIKTDSVTVNVLTAPVAPLISAGGTLSFCEGDSVQLSVTGTTGYSYQWKLNGGAFGLNSNLYTAKSSGTYSLTVSNSSGCTVDATNTVTVTVNSKPALPTVNLSGPTSFCQGGSIELSVTNNTAYTYQWENDGSAIGNATTNAYTAQTPGKYSLKITNASGCYIKTSNVTVTVLAAPSAPLISSGTATEFCQGDSVILSVTGTSGFTYQWKLSGIAVGVDSNRIAAINSGAYSLVVSDANGCSALSANTVNVTVNPLPNVSTINLSGPTTFCQGGSVIMSVPSTEGYTYNWRNDYGLISGANTNSYTVGTSGKYQLEIANSSGCAVKTSPVSITVKAMPNKPVIESANYEAGKCPGENMIRLYASQSIQEYQYQWYKDGLPLACSTLSNLELNEQGNYKLEANLDGCKVESDVFVINFPEAPEKPFIYARGPTLWYLVCSDITASKYKWYCNDRLIEGADKYYYVANRKMGDYQVSVGNSKGCFTMSDVASIPTGITGIEDIDPFEGLMIYPNPTKGMFTIELDNEIFGELMISIITEQGKEIRSVRLEKSEEHFSTEVDLSSEAKGMYLINLMIDKYLATRKVIVE